MKVASPQDGNPTKPITVTTTGGTLRSVVASAPDGTRLPGVFGTRKTSWKTTTGLAFGKSYAVAAEATNSAGRLTSITARVSTVKPTALVFPSFLPSAATTDIGVGEPVQVQFLKSPKDTAPVPVTDRSAIEKLLTVMSYPAQPGAWRWISDNVIDYRPATFWRPGTTIRLNVRVGGSSFGNGAYGKEDRNATYKVHDSWVAKADGVAETMGIYHNDQLVKSMPISMGKQATPTHLGVHVISDQANPYRMNSCTYGVCSGPEAYISDEYYASRISEDGEFVHENPKSVAQQGSTNVSHGCINLNPANAKWFFNHFGIGDVVEVTNSGGPTLPVKDMWGDWSLNWNTWKAGNAHS